ncbi:ran-binding protein m [Anaeramoeba flamelloides]|uniref:Ran-binding protein m n=1 Tax=Anaeramoeba flamelloides TaxID=1746091 RepID=A0AAV7ZZM2_9EUKA|nr:ran-binding protein m [Anaeramoeba flamelloides]
MSGDSFGSFSDSDNENRVRNLEAEYENRFGIRRDLLLSNSSDDSDSEVLIDGSGYRDQIDTIQNRLRGYPTRNRNENETPLFTERRRNRLRSRIQNRARNRNQTENETETTNENENENENEEKQDILPEVEMLFQTLQGETISQDEDNEENKEKLENDEQDLIDEILQDLNAYYSEFKSEKENEEKEKEKEKENDKDNENELQKEKNQKNSSTTLNNEEVHNTLQEWMISYLVGRCHKKTFSLLLKELTSTGELRVQKFNNLELSRDFENRKKVVQLIQDGEIEKAIHFLHENFGSIFSEKEKGSDQVLFKVYCQQFVELIKKGKTTEALLFSKEKLKPFVNSNKQFLTTLQEHLSLLAYQELTKFPSDYLLKEDMRWKLAQEVNGRILEAVGVSKCDFLKQIIRQSKNVTNSLKEVN